MTNYDWMILKILSISYIIALGKCLAPLETKGESYSHKAIMAKLNKNKPICTHDDKIISPPVLISTCFS